MKVLWIIEDDKLVGESIQEMVSSDSVKVVLMTTAAEFKKTADEALQGQRTRPHAILSDLHLQSNHSLTTMLDDEMVVLFKLINSEVLLLTGDQSEKVAERYSELRTQGIISDIVIKPIGKPVLLAKITHALENGWEKALKIKFGSIDHNNLIFSNTHGSFELTCSELKFIAQLMLKEPDGLMRLSKANAKNARWGQNVTVVEKNIDVMVSRLRKKLKTINLSLTTEDGVYRLGIVD